MGLNPRVFKPELLIKGYGSFQVGDGYADVLDFIKLQI